MRLLKRGVACLLVITVFWLASLPASIAAYAHVYGTAVDEEGGRLSDVRVLVYTSGGVLVANTSTGSDGFFGISGFFWTIPGTYNIHLTKPGYAKAVKSITLQYYYDIDLGTIVLYRAVRLSTSTLSLIAGPGDRISLPFTVSNTGEETEDAELLTSEPEDWSVRVLDQSRQVTKVCISPGQSLALQLEVTISPTSLVDIGASVLALGVTPTVEDVARLVLFMVFSILFAMTYYGIAAFLSTVSKKTTQSVIVGVVLWAVFTFVIPIVAALVAFVFMPMRFTPGQSQEEMERFAEEIRKRTAITETITSVTPNYHFTKIAQYILQAYAALGMGQGQGQTGARTVSIMESLVFAWPNILVLTLTTALTFIASYIVFTRQEVR